ncbi:MAG: peptidylprolyl isomerase, partial [Deltaproteobacteria bacterium]
MLKKLRNKKTAKKIWIVLAIILVPAFVWWGTGSITRDRPQSLYAGVIFGKKISTLEYQDALNAVRNLATLKYGDKLPEMSKYMNLEAQAWERLVLLKEGQKLRLSASDKEVVDTIQNLPFFQSNGRFNDRAYSDILQYELHIQPRAFEEQTRQNIIVAKLYNQITAPVTIKDEEVREEYQKDNEQISVYYIAALSADFAKEINASDQEIRDYFAKNSLDFKQPFSFSVEYASFAAQEYGEQQAKDMIKKIFQRLNKKEDFSSVAKDFGSTVKESGLFSETGPIPGVGWAPQVIGIISRTKAGEYLPPIRMDSSYYIMKVKEIKAPFIPDFDAIKDKVKEALV